MYDGESYGTVVFMREKTGVENIDLDASWGFKLTALLHEIGHVTDFENEENFDLEKKTLELVAAEVYAHHHACRNLVKRKLRRPLGKYLHAIREMGASTSEYVRMGAKQVMESPAFRDYEKESIPD